MYIFQTRLINNARQLTIFSYIASGWLVELYAASQ